MNERFHNSELGLEGTDQIENAIEDLQIITDAITRHCKNSNTPEYDNLLSKYSELEAALRREINNPQTKIDIRNIILELGKKKFSGDIDVLTGLVERAFVQLRK